MERKRNVVCAMVIGDAEDLNRATLREEFSKFGNVTKIFVEGENKYAKVYFDNPESVKRACNRLNGQKSWEVTFYKDDYKKTENTNDPNSNYNSGTSTRRPLFDLDRFSGTSSNQLEEMEEDCFYAGEYVDVHGRPVEVLQAENGQLFVNLDDVRTAGFNIYPKESFENATIPKEVNMRQFENYLLNQGKKYILNMKQTFNEGDMLNVFERVRVKLQNAEPSMQFGDRQLINNPQSRNFTITTRNSSSPSGPSRGGGFQNANNRPPRQLPENFQPSFSFNKNKRSYHENQNEQSQLNDSRRNQNNPRNRRGEGAMWDRKSNDKRVLVEANGTSQMRQPRSNDFRTNAVKSEPVVDNKQPEESWEDETTAATSSKADPAPEVDPTPKADPTPKVDPTPKADPLPKLQNDATSHSNESTVISVDRINWTPGSNYKVKVSYLSEEKKGIFYSQSNENQNLLEEILLHVNTQDCELPVINKPIRDMLCVAYFEDTWYRAVVLKIRANSHPFVELIDYGNKEEIEVPLREISDEMKTIPGQAVRCTLDTSDVDRSFAIDEDLEIFVKKQFNDLTHLVEVKKFLELEKVNVEPKTPPSEVCSDVDVNRDPTPSTSSEEVCFTEIIPSSAKVEPGETVIIVNYTQNKLLLRNKEVATICKNMYTHLHSMQKKPVNNPKVGQLVLCSKDTNEGLHRAIIKKINDKAAELEFVDYYGGEILALKSLRNVDEVLAGFPRAIIELDYPVLEQLIEQSEAMLVDLIFQKKKLKTTLVEGRLDLLLTESDKTVLLSEKIQNCAKQEGPEKTTQPASTVGKSEQESADPPAKQEATTAAQEGPSTSAQKISTAAAQIVPSATVEKVPSEEEYVDVLYDQMPYVTAQLGRGEYSCYSCRGNSVTLMALSEENIAHLAELDIGEPSDKTSHAPALFHMCLAKFQDTWYRALVTEIDDDIFEVLFVDYGNAENVHKSNLRRFPKNLSTVPMLGISAYFLGIPNTPKVHNRIKQLIPDETILEIDVKEDVNDELKYGIEIPSIYEILKKEGLI